MNETPTTYEFPISGLLPKKETAVLSFLSKYPNYDGTGTVIAIFDSGIDPGAPGLKVTSDGKPKIIGRYDCSGCGDVNISTVVTPTNGVITGLTGRKLKIPTSWNNPQGTYRVGVKHAFDLYPDRLKDRMKHEYKKKMWDKHQRKCVADVNREIAEFDTKHPNANLTGADKLTKEDLDAKLEILTNYEKKFLDLGPVYDCIVFHDGDKWMCCVDTSETGDLTDCPLLGEFNITRDYAPLTKDDQLNFSINVHNDGNLLELVGVCSSHGTHVASIAAGCFPDDPDQNGVAPGAQIISLTIGDGRLGSMETGTALVRAMIKVMELSETTKIHVINMSYGERARWVDAGHIGELMNEIVNKYGVVWVASAGNNGPALQTVTTPSDISQEPIISVGAYVSPDMMIAEYAMSQRLSGTPYTWSSRGPTVDGALGVHICAPGGAITSVPNFTLRYSQLMNGTSMASPHVAGCVAILISGLTNKNILYTPYSIKRALENTAQYIKGVEVHAQGCGLVQIDKAFEYLVNYQREPEVEVRFQIACGSANRRGIYLRTKLHKDEHNIKVSVEPYFFDNENISHEKKINFNMKLVLTCDASYVTIPSHLDVSNVARMFAVKINTGGLEEGVHATFLMAYDVKCVEKGPVFKVPITVIVPKDVNESRNMIRYDNVAFKPNTIKRHYYNVNDNATWAVLKMNSDDDNGRFVVHVLQALPKQISKTLETVKTVSVSSNSETVVSFQVRGGLVLELVIAKYWASIGDVNLNYSLHFYGVKPTQPAITMHAADGIHQVDVETLQGEEVSPSVTLKNSVQIVKPTEGKITPLTQRDIIPPNRQIYELILVYNFNIVKQCEVSPNFVLLSDLLYENEYESQFWMLYDSNKQLMGCGDAYPSKYTVKLEKGDYVIRLQIRLDKKDYLEKLQEIPILIQQKLSSNITMDVYLSYTQALIGGKKAGIFCNSNPNLLIPLYISPLTSDKFTTKSNNAAHYLTGVVTYAKDEHGKKVDSYPIKYILCDNVPKKSAATAAASTSTTAANAEKTTKLDEYNEAVRDLKTQWLTKLDAGNAEIMYETFIGEYPEHLAFHTAFLQQIEPIDKRILPSIKNKSNTSKADLNKIIKIAEKVIEAVKQETLLAYLATKTDVRPDAAKFKTAADQQKNQLIESVCRKGIALCRLSLIDTSDEWIIEEIGKLWKILLKFVDPSDAKVLTSPVLYFSIWHSFINKHYGRLLKYLIKLQEDKSQKEIEERIVEFSQVVNWEHVSKHLLRALPSKFPTAYKPF